MPEHPDSQTTPSHLDEFGVISRFFTDSGSSPSAWPSQGIGDDCAFLDIGQARVAVTSDMMALGSHFLEDADPYTVGRKSLAVNLSDLAAAGAIPRAFFLSISLPSVNTEWLEGYSRGLFEESHRFDCPLRGGDTVKSFIRTGEAGYTAISICAMGELPPGEGLTRSGAIVGDDIWVSGTPGDAFAALGCIWGYWKLEPEAFAYFRSRMDTPEPRVALGRALLAHASACCDISDGLFGDLKHILERSQVSAELFWENFPLSEPMTKLSPSVQRRCVLSGGDDYELLFTAHPSCEDQIRAAARQVGVRVTKIGRILPRAETVRILGAAGELPEAGSSFNHFGA